MGEGYEGIWRGKREGKWEKSGGIWRGKRGDMEWKAEGYVGESRGKWRGKRIFFCEMLHYPRNKITFAAIFGGEDGRIKRRIRWNQEENTDGFGGEEGRIRRRRRVDWKKEEGRIRRRRRGNGGNKRNT